MGYYVADFVNGRNLSSGAPVVGFLVNAQPRTDDPNNSALRSGDFFSLESFPIFGTAEEGGLMYVDDESSFAVRMALKMTDSADWEQLSRHALEQRRGVQLLGQPDKEGYPTNQRAYGLALMHRETYDYLVLGERSALATACSSDGYRGEHRVRADKEPDIDRVKMLLNACLEHAAELGPLRADMPDPVTHVQVLGDLTRICALHSDWDVQERVFPIEANLPRLLSCLSVSDGRLIGMDLHATLYANQMLGHCLLTKGHLSVDEVPDFNELLSLLWDAWHLRNRMYDVHAEFKPSSCAGQDSNQPSILALGRITMQGVWSELVEDFAAHRNTPQRAAQMKEELAQLEGLLATMREQLDGAI